MSSAEIIYSFRNAYPNVLERARQQVSTMECWRSGALVAPTATGSSYALIGPDGLTKATPTVSVTSSIATVTLTAAMLPATLTLGEGYLEEWTLVLADATTRVIRREAALARRAFYPVVVDADLESAYPDLATFRGPAISTWQTFVDEAWKQIIDRLRAEGHFPYLIMSVTSFREAHKQLALHLIFNWMYLKQPADRWKTLADDHRRDFALAWGRINFVLDTDHDGLADDDARHSARKVIHFNGAPQRSLARTSRW